MKNKQNQIREICSICLVCHLRHVAWREAAESDWILQRRTLLLLGSLLNFISKATGTAQGRVDMKRENNLKGDKMRAERRKQQVRLQHQMQSGSDAGVLVLQVRKEDVQEASPEVLTHREIGEAPNVTRMCV